MGLGFGARLRSGGLNDGRSRCRSERTLSAPERMRYLRGLAELEERSQLMEFTINERAVDMAEKIVAAEPKVVGIGVYIWNVDVVQRLVRIVRQIRPDVSIVLGGPEVSYEQEQQHWLKDADYVICGEGEGCCCVGSCRAIVRRFASFRAPPGMDRLVMPYRLQRRGHRHRVIYVEASRGCPYLCVLCPCRWIRRCKGRSGSTPLRWRPCARGAWASSSSIEPLT